MGTPVACVWHYGTMSISEGVDEVSYAGTEVNYFHKRNWD